MNPDLPRWNIVLHAWRILIENSGAALRLSVLPFLLLVVMHRVTAIVDPQGPAAILWQFLYIVIFTVPVALLLVPWYRLILSARWPELANRPNSAWYVAFILRTLGLELMLYAVQFPSIVASIMATMGDGEPDLELMKMATTFLLVLPLGFYLYGRAGLALPAAAGGHVDTYRRAWDTTAGAGWRVGIIVFLLWVSFIIIGALLTGITDAGAPPPHGFAGSVIDAAVDIVRELTLAAGLALVYLHYSGAPAEDVFS